ncbi:uncharacterized protein [Amphiura filiformis]|uniref:uncharacterized protein n=1 Tax=Amphiura filiformis TaxID=82378 RepID=UPI003B21AF26
MACDDKNIFINEMEMVEQDVSREGGVITNSNGISFTSNKLRWGTIVVLMMIVISNILTAIGVYVNMRHQRQYPQQKDINECNSITDNCDANAVCPNTVGSFACACNAGYSGNGITCTDINECCSSTDNCDANAACTNTVGSFTCACNAGYSGDGETCTDINECALNNDYCDGNANCTNTVGSFTCTCDAGYSGNGETCTG